MTSTPTNQQQPNAGATGWAGIRAFVRERWDLVTLVVLAVAMVTYKGRR